MLQLTAVGSLRTGSPPGSVLTRSVSDVTLFSIFHFTFDCPVRLRRDPDQGASRVRGLQRLHREHRVETQQVHRPHRGPGCPVTLCLVIIVKKYALKIKCFGPLNNLLKNKGTVYD